MEPSKCYDHIWLVPERVILSTLVGKTTLDDIAGSDKEVLAMLDVGTPPIHIIVDCTNLESVPVNLTQVIARMTHLHDPNLGNVVAFGVNRWVRFMASAIFPFTKTHLQFVNTQEEALASIKQLDDTIE
jgi:hypothetical protein